MIIKIVKILLIGWDVVGVEVVVVVVIEVTTVEEFIVADEVTCSVDVIIVIEVTSIEEFIVVNEVKWRPVISSGSFDDDVLVIADVEYGEEDGLVTVEVDEVVETVVDMTTVLSNVVSVSVGSHWICVKYTNRKIIIFNE